MTLTMLTMSPLLLLLLTLWMMLTVPMGLCGLCWLWWPPARPSWTQVPPLLLLPTMPLQPGHDAPSL
jgi:hypothetical protein